MSTYAIGDIQGCFDTLQSLLEKIEFEPTKDTLWVAGDLVNRGPKSLETLRYLAKLPKCKVVLGNHDLHLLASAYGNRDLKGKDTLDAVFSAPDRIDLLEWLRHQPLLHYSQKKDFVMTHAGIPPQWDLEKAQKLAKEVEMTLQNDALAGKFFKKMYGNEPSLWSNHLDGMKRLRVIVNYFTRMRFIDFDGRLDLETKESADAAPDGMMPWFLHPNRKTAKQRILFGHWAALNGEAQTENVFALDTGCVWGGYLTALNLKTLKTKRCKNRER